ncbi:HAD family hydrolase [Kovacikia minuta]|uniref:hypothetical protein n=1 Tax=Kovacikia minuta TaxID=2931930 RepID=UPI0036F31BBB
MSYLISFAGELMESANHLSIPTTKSAIVVFDIDGVVRDVGGSYRRALADTVEHFTNGAYRPAQVEIDQLKSEGIWNNDWEASQELIYRYFERQGQPRPTSPTATPHTPHLTPHTPTATPHTPHPTPRTPHPTPHTPHPPPSPTRNSLLSSSPVIGDLTLFTGQAISARNLY